MSPKQYKINKGNPGESPFENNLPYKLAHELPFDTQEPITFADFEVEESEHHMFQMAFWMFNGSHRENEWKYATKHFPSASGKFDVVRVWKAPNNKSIDE